MPWEPLPSGRGRDPAPIGEALDRVARGLGVASAESLTRLFSGWEDVVGPDVAAHSRPLDLRSDTLVVAVDDPAWATQLRSFEGLVLERLQARLSDQVITRLVVRVRPQ